MFTVNEILEGSTQKYILRDEDSETYAVIVPQWSAMVQKFAVSYGANELNVIDSYRSEEEFNTSLKELGFKGCKLSPFVCRIENGSYQFGGKEYKLEKSLPAKDALHGELYDRAFTVIGQTANEEEASVTMKCEYRGEDPGYPFDYDCIVTWRLREGNRLTVETESINQDTGLIPMQDGWHPYFTFGKQIDELQLEFQAMEILEFNEKLIPTGKLSEYTKFTSLEPIGDRVFDNCFTLNMDTCQPMCVLRDKENNVQVELHPSASYPYLQIYTPEHRNSIAIENISGAPNAFNNEMGYKTLEPGEAAIFATTYKITILNNENG